MYYLTDQNIELARARRRREAASKAWNVHPGSPPPSLYSGRKDSVASPVYVMDDEVAPFRELVPEEEKENAFHPHSTALVIQDARPYLQQCPYPLPCDLDEMHRQNVKALLFETVFNGPTRTLFPMGLPREVLEVGCGNGYWSSSCHDHFKCLGQDDVAFTGMDMVQLAPKLRESGVEWSFVQYDLRRMPWPFLDGTFDYVMVKDMSLAIPLDQLPAFLEECARVLSDNGTLEIRDSNPLVRSVVNQGRALTPDTLSRVFQITEDSVLGPPANRFLQESNTWIEQACRSRNLACLPCETMTAMLSKMTHLFHDVSSRHVAIPFREMPFEVQDCSQAAKQKSKASAEASVLTPDQAAVRETALLISLQQIEAMGPVLKEINGKSNEGWSSWLSNLASSLMQENGANSGECLEMVALCATKRKK